MLPRILGVPRLRDTEYPHPTHRPIRTAPAVLSPNLINLPISRPAVSPPTAVGALAYFSRLPRLLSCPSKWTSVFPVGQQRNNVGQVKSIEDTDVLCVTACFPVLILLAYACSVTHTTHTGVAHSLTAHVTKSTWRPTLVVDRQNVFFCVWRVELPGDCGKLSFQIRKYFAVVFQEVARTRKGLKIPPVTTEIMSTSREKTMHVNPATHNRNRRAG